MSRKRKADGDPVRESQDQANWSMWRSSFRPIRWRGGRLPKNPTSSIFLATVLVVAVAAIGLFVLFAILRLVGV
jgi:hypothetical protein